MRERPSKFVNAVAWVDGETDPIRRRQRKAIHILLTAIAQIRPHYTLCAKGGVLLG